MTETKTRRSVLASGAATLAALGGFGAAASWLGRNRDKTAVNEQPSTKTSTKTPTNKTRTVDRVLDTRAEHWVGDGFRVRSVISPDGDPRLQSPFLLLDHAARRHFDPSDEQRGVREHPHRGFETVTFAYRGEIAHRDSAGGGGLIGTGDVQWMTAAGGIVHEEMHSPRFTHEGGDMEMVQLWVNLPAKSKMTKPGYQPLLDKDFPRLNVGAANARLIAGELARQRGPAHTHTPITLFDLHFAEDGISEFELPAGFTSLTFSLEGELHVGADDQPLQRGALAVLGRGDTGTVRLRGAKDARVLVLAGEPIDEPVASYGPFVMNTRAEIVEAVNDYQSGKMGHL